MNQHPAVMFEIVALEKKAMLAFYSYVFGWSYEVGTGDFANVRFHAEARPLLGDIGQATSEVPGFESPATPSNCSSTTSTPLRSVARGTWNPRLLTATASP